MKAQSLKKALETAAASATRSKDYVLRLYVTGATPMSRRAILNINAICSEHLQGDTIWRSSIFTRSRLWRRTSRL